MKCGCESGQLIVAGHRGDHKIVITQCIVCKKTRTYKLIKEEASRGEQGEKR